MDVERSLVQTVLENEICLNIKISDIDYTELSENHAVKILNEIQEVLFKCERLTDFEIVDEIADIFVKNNLDIGGCHDF